MFALQEVYLETVSENLLALALALERSRLKIITSANPQLAMKLVPQISQQNNDEDDEVYGCEKKLSSNKKG